MKSCLKIAIVLLIFCSNAAAQVSIGQWRDHLPFSEAIGVAASETKIYCATPLAIFYLDREDNSLNRITKVQGLSDIDISYIAYHEGQKLLFVGYVNGNIDLITDNNEILNFADIKRSSITASKSINEVIFVDDMAYLSCGYGISIFDLKKREFADS
ncbi:MAG: hypothetical protein MRY83_14625, partial [Flavobacteriales bacterium]|nr:hypothetical protein [Flavobacteriales bacterium]